MDPAVAKPASDPNDLVHPPPQVLPYNGAGANLNNLIVDSEVEPSLVPSEDYDVKDAFCKKVKRESKEPSFRGWKEVGGWEVADTLTEQDLLEDLSTKNTLMDQYLPPVAYGEWYHSVGYILAAGLLLWIVGWFRFSLAVIFIIMLPLSLVYRASIRKYRSYIREQVQREFSVKAIENGYETMDWINTMLDKYWFYLEPLISQIVTEQANPILATLPIPAFIKALWIDSFTVGTKPFRVDCVKTLPGTEKDIVVMDWGVLFTPNSLADCSNKQLKNKVNQKVVVKVSLFGLTIPIVVQDVAFKSLVRVRFRLMASFPHVKTVNVTLLEPPSFDFNSKVLLGDNFLNWEVINIPGLYPLINAMVKKYVGAMLYLPLLFQLNIEQLMAGNSLDAAMGVLEVKIKSAKNLRGFFVLGNTMDPYLHIGFHKSVLAKTKVIEDTDAPTWNETHYIPVTSLSEPLNIKVIDWNPRHKDRDVGVIQYDLEPLYNKPNHPNLTAPFLQNNKNVGTLAFDLNFMPTLEPIRQVDGSVTPAPDLSTGIARIEIGNARHIVGETKSLKLLAEIYIDQILKKTTHEIKGTDAPAFNSNHEEIIFNRPKTKVRVVLKNNGKKYGQIISTLNNLIDASQVSQNWFPFAKGGEISLRTVWKPVSLGGASGSGGFTPPIGVVRVDVEKADDLRNLERVGKIDPYARILVNGIEKARTAPKDSDLNPVWNEIHYVTVTSPNQKLTIDVMDVEKVGDDRTLGKFDVILKDIINKDENGKYTEWIDTEKRESKLIHKKGPKGTVTYKLSFYPTLPVKTLEDIQEEKEAAEAEKKRALKEEEEKKKAAAAGVSEKDVSKAKKEEETAKPEEVDDEDELEDSSKVQLSLEELAEHQSGVLVVEVIDAQLSKDDLYLQVFADNHGYADFVSRKITKKQVKINNVFEVILTELDWSKLLFRLTKDHDDHRLEKPSCETTITSLQLLKNAYNKPTTIQLNGASTASFKVQVQWFPIIYKIGIPVQDSFKNSGILTANALRAKDIPAGDSNGKLDPYVKLFLNNSEDSFFKSNKIKKTLEPVWNESATVEVYNLYDTVIRAEVYDWDIGLEQDDFLCEAYFPLAEYDATNNHEEVAVPLKDEAGNDAGVIYLSFSFKPSAIINVRRKTTNPVAIGGKVGKGVGKGIGKGVGKGLGGGAKLLKRGLHLGKVSENED